jgi:BASS family bile acid:Na+ symporter
METLKQLIPLLISGSLTLLVVAVGLHAKTSDLTSMLRRPGLLARSLLAISVVVPVAAGLVVWYAPIDPVAKAGIIAMAVSPLPPLVAGKGLKAGADKDYIYGLYVTVSVLAIVIVPLTLAILSAVFPADAAIRPLAVARMVLTSVLIPLAIGMLLRVVAPDLARRAAPMVRSAAMLALVLGFAPVLVISWPAIAGLIGDGTMLAMAVVSAVGLFAGHLLGGPERPRRAALALACATRHPGLAILLLKVNVPEMHTGPAAVILFMLVGMVVAIPYQVWLKRSAPAAVAA